jgi:hypothetical protein
VVVIVKLFGGVGNQLFQYAAARRLALMHHTELKLDITHLTHEAVRPYRLNPFRIREVLATPQEVAELKGTAKKGLERVVFRAGQKMKPYYRRSVFAERHLKPFDPNILKTPKDVYMHGYWQSEKYFAEIQELIRHEFTVKYEQDAPNRSMAKEIANVDSVSIHVRRGDYVSDPKTNRFHGTCDLDYYFRSVEFIAEKVPSIQFFVFSDDPEWVTGNLKLRYPSTVVTLNGPSKGYEDLRLMSMCRHNIIANSSFSWWGAWLNPNPDKLVLGPRRWFREAGLDTRDLLPNSWIRI